MMQSFGVFLNKPQDKQRFVDDFITMIIQVTSLRCGQNDILGFDIRYWIPFHQRQSLVR